MACWPDSSTAMLVKLRVLPRRLDSRGSKLFSGQDLLGQPPLGKADHPGAHWLVGAALKASRESDVAYGRFPAAIGRVALRVHVRGGRIRRHL